MRNTKHTPLRQVVMLSEIATESLTIACPKCGLVKTFNVVDAIRLRGDVGLPKVLSRATCDCPRKARMSDPCGAVYVESLSSRP